MAHLCSVATVSIGVDNLANKRPPMFCPRGSNSHTDAYTYDQIGRYYWSAPPCRSEA